jgi:hypothetical protein
MDIIPPSEGGGAGSIPAGTATKVGCFADCVGKDRIHGLTQANNAVVYRPYSTDPTLRRIYV